MIWWASQPNRARSERLAIADLQEANDWLRNVAWRLTTEVRLCADFEIEHLGQLIPLTLTYPDFFPDVPPQVTPREEVRLSGHQYGAGGELCLEFRPDNWEPRFTGAMMIESAHRLLSGEEPTAGEAAEVANAHRTTIGQDVRGATYRFVVSEDFCAASAKAPLHTALDAEIIEHFIAKHWLAFPRRIGAGDEVHWEGADPLPDSRTRKGYFVRLAGQFAEHVKAQYGFFELLVGVLDREDIIDRFASSDAELVFLIECDGIFKLMSLAPGTGKRSVYDYRTVLVPKPSDRLSADYDRLQAASAAIVGCGSLGSKIAASLARAGVGRFLLVDADLFFPGNLVRNELDWRAVGLNKPNGVAARIAEIRPSAQVDVRRINLGAQESSALTDATLVAIGKCGIIIDATADAQAFNLLGSVARNEQKPLVWGEVFGGGIGGLVGRLRPGFEPVPHAARRQILDWCAEHGVAPPEGSAVQYGLDLLEDAPPLIADDADVALIAGHMTKFALDILLRSETIFPQSAYAIGLKAGWIFEAPFDTWPINLTPEGEWGPEKEAQLAEGIDAFIAEFFPQAAGDEPA